jgi:hypothetical protein
MQGALTDSESTIGVLQIASYNPSISSYVKQTVIGVLVQLHAMTLEDFIFCSIKHKIKQQ